MTLRDAYSGRRVLITGNTGFKGAWLCEWLASLGAQVTGFSLEPPTDPGLFDQLALRDRIRHMPGDVRDASAVNEVVDDVQPEFVFHLAAQPLVRLSYREPAATYATNVMGTVHVLDAVRLAGRPCNVVVVTTDKCYENREWVHSYREEDAMGGYDPYSSSKGAAELVVAAYRRSFFTESSVHLASARAGNVIGGGDWAEDRIIPDCIRALRAGEAIPVRNKVATRPWQHVLEPLSGYLTLGAAMAGALQVPFGASSCASGFNFGPNLTSNRTVAQLVSEVLLHWPGQWIDKCDPAAVHEARLLNLATDKAFHFLGWKPVWGFEETVEKTIEWYRRAEECSSATDFAELTIEHINQYVAAAADAGVPWAA